MLNKFKKKNRKSCWLARTLSIILPGLGSIYVGNYFKGILYLVPAIAILVLEKYVLSLWTHLLEVNQAMGTHHYRGGLKGILIIAIGYFAYSTYSAKESSYDAAQFNMRKALLEEET